MAFELSVCGRDRCAVAWICGECDINDAAMLRDALLDVLARESPWLVLDLSRLRFLDCAGAGALVEADRRARSLGGALVVTAPTVIVARLLQATGLSACLAIYPAVDTAVARIGPGPISSLPITAIG